jgi:hypothetical protein
MSFVLEKVSADPIRKRHSSVVRVWTGGLALTEFAVLADGAGLLFLPLRTRILIGMFRTANHQNDVERGQGES